MLKVGYKSDVGKVRENNEDSFYVDPKAGLFIVADGMGGHKAGEVASRMAVKRIREQLDASCLPQDEEGIQSVLRETIRKANAEIYRHGGWYEALRGMGTTVVVALIREGRLHVAHVGDSRAYLLQNGTLLQLTEDHTHVARMVREGQLSPEEARGHHLRHVLIRVLGGSEQVEVDLTVLPYQGEPLLLCTDGLTDMLEGGEIQEILSPLPEPQRACELLVEKAIENGGRDNVTVVVVKK